MAAGGVQAARGWRRVASARREAGEAARAALVAARRAHKSVRARPPLLQRAADAAAVSERQRARAHDLRAEADGQ